jgi:hypothetical protein
MFQNFCVEFIIRAIGNGYQIPKYVIDCKLKGSILLQKYIANMIFCHATICYDISTLSKQSVIHFTNVLIKY